MRDCRPHTDPRRWLDGPTVAGRVRTTCALCGRFIGYRTTRGASMAFDDPAGEPEQGAEQADLFDERGFHEAATI